MSERLEWQIKKCFKLDRENEELKTQLVTEKESNYSNEANYLAKKTRELQAQLAKAEKVIKFYGDRSGWHMDLDIDFSNGTFKLNRECCGVVLNAAGKTAREYLTKRKECEG